MGRLCRQRRRSRRQWRRLDRVALLGLRMLLDLVDLGLLLQLLELMLSLVPTLVRRDGRRTRRRVGVVCRLLDVARTHILLLLLLLLRVRVLLLLLVLVLGWRGLRLGVCCSGVRGGRGAIIRGLTHEHVANGTKKRRENSPEPGGTSSGRVWAPYELAVVPAGAAAAAGAT